MRDKDILYSIALSLLPNIGPVTARNLIAYAGGIEDVFNLKLVTMAKIPGIGSQTIEKITTSSALEAAKREMDFIIKHRIKTVLFQDANYPSLLKNCNDAPLILFYIGNEIWQEGKILSVIGTRKPTPENILFTDHLVSEAIECMPSINIISGLAYGIDVTAHKASLKNNGKTMAILGHGLNLIYPAAHKKIASEIINQGCLLTEFPSVFGIDRTNFVRRNRIIAGISDAVLVAASGVRGGAMITADMAISYDREVFAFAGRPNDEKSMGCNDLIKRNKAALVDNFSDIAYAMNWIQSPIAKQLSLFKDMTDMQKQIYSVLKAHSLLSIDELSMITNLPGSLLLANLLEMEFNGNVLALPGKVFKAI